MSGRSFNRSAPFAAFITVSLLILSSCNGDRVPTTPTQFAVPPTPVSPPQQASPEPQIFRVSGAVTGDRGAQLAGAVVTMAHGEGGPVQWPSALTGTSGSYAIEFTASPLRRSTGRFVARAEIAAQGYELYWRSLIGDNSSFIENFRLQHIQRVTAGDSIAVSFAPDIGECPGWVAQVCGTVRVVALTQGNVTVEVMTAGQIAQSPELEACCAAGTEVYGNPVTVPADRGMEIEVRVGLGHGLTSVQSFMVKTSLDPF